MKLGFPGIISINQYMFFSVDVEVPDGSVRKLTSRLYSDVGMDEIFVSRLFHIQNDLLNDLLNLENIKEIKEVMTGLILEDLEKAFRSLRELRKDWVDSQIPEKKKKQNVENIFSYLTIAIQRTFLKLSNLMGYDISFYFSNDENKFEAGCKNFIDLHQEIGLTVVDFLKNNKSWSDLMIAIRNKAIEHRINKDKNLLADLESYMTLVFSEQFFDNCWRFIEELLFIYTYDLTKSKSGIQLVELSEYKDNKNYPQRFAWVITNIN